MQVDYPRDLLCRQLLPYMVHEIRQHADNKWALELADRDARAQKHTLVQQRVNLANKVHAKVGR